MKSAIESFAEFFASKGWTYSRDTEKPVINLGFTGENGRWQCLAVAGPKDSHLLFMSLLPCRVAPNRRPQVAELISRINWGLPHGCFEMDFKDGEVRFRTSLILQSPEVPLEQVGDLVFSNLWAADHFFGTLMQVTYTKATPRNALAALADASKPAATSSMEPPSDHKRRFELN